MSSLYSKVLTDPAAILSGPSGDKAVQSVTAALAPKLAKQLAPPLVTAMKPHVLSLVQDAAAATKKEGTDRPGQATGALLLGEERHRGFLFSSSCGYDAMRTNKKW